MSSTRLADVALRAGVSVITASRVLRTPGLVAPATRARVEEAVRALGYVPNLVAGALASARTRTAGVLVPTLSSAIFATTVNGLTDALEAEGWSILVAQSGYDAAREEHALAALLGRRPEGVVMVGSPATAAAAAMLRQAAAGGAVVVESWDLPATPIGAAVGFDNAAAGAAVAGHFAAAGRQRLAFIGGADPRAEARWAGFAAGAARAGLAPPLRLALRAPAAMDDAAAACPALDPADAVFAANDIHAVALLAALARHGRRVPREVAVVGLGDLELSRHVIPALSTVRIDGAAIGRHAAGLILAGPRPGEAARLDTGFTLVLRDSG